MTTWSGDSDAALSSTATTPQMKEKQNDISERMRGSEDDVAAAALVSAFATSRTPPCEWNWGIMAGQSGVFGMAPQPPPTTIVNKGVAVVSKKKTTTKTKARPRRQERNSNYSSIAKKRIKPKCNFEGGCTNNIIAVKGGVCKTHGGANNVTKKKKCTFETCTNGAVKGGVCITHGAHVSSAKAAMQKRGMYQGYC